MPTFVNIFCDGAVTRVVSCKIPIRKHGKDLFTHLYGLLINVLRIKCLFTPKERCKWGMTIDFSHVRLIHRFNV